MSDELQKDDLTVDEKANKDWEPPALRFVGRIGDVFKFPGGGKLSPTGGDQGDMRKQSGNDP